MKHFINPNLMTVAIAKWVWKDTEKVANDMTRQSCLIFNGILTTFTTSSLLQTCHSTSKKSISKKKQMLTFSKSVGLACHAKSKRFGLAFLLFACSSEAFAGQNLRTCFTRRILRLQSGLAPWLLFWIGWGHWLLTYSPNWIGYGYRSLTYSPNWIGCGYRLLTYSNRLTTCNLKK